MDEEHLGYPGTDATLDVASSQTIHQCVAEGALDVGFTETAPDSDELDFVVFASDELVAIAQPGRPLVRKRRVTPEAFCREPFVVRATGSDTRSFVERALAARGLSVTPVMSLGSTEAMI